MFENIVRRKIRVRRTGRGRVVGQGFLLRLLIILKLFDIAGTIFAIFADNIVDCGVGNRIPIEDIRRIFEDSL